MRLLVHVPVPTGQQVLRQARRVLRHVRRRVPRQARLQGFLVQRSAGQNLPRANARHPGRVGALVEVASRSQ